MSTPAIFNEKGKGAISKNECAIGGLNNLGFTDSTYGHWQHRL